MVAVTLLVVGSPIAAVWWLRVSGTLTSPVLAVIVGMVLSLGVSQAGRMLWQTRPGSEDLLFSELMLWGFLHRRHSQRRLESAHAMLGALGEGQARSARDKTRLLERLVAEIETRDPYLHGHSRRVARHSWMIAKRMGLSRDEVARIRTAAAIHDVGKVRTPAAILHKAGALDEEEFAVIKLHPLDGAQMVNALGDDRLTAIVLHHHERLDGSGYPFGLAEDEVPLGARIVAVADTFDAITSSRPYRSASPHKKAIDILKDEAGSKLDAAVVQAFCSHYSGRRFIALSMLVTGLPERALSWLGGSAGSVASAVKVVAAAALLAGGTVATASTLEGGAKHSPPALRTASNTRELAVLPGGLSSALTHRGAGPSPLAHNVRRGVARRVPHEVAPPRSGLLVPVKNAVQASPPTSAVAGATTGAASVSLPLNAGGSQPQSANQPSSSSSSGVGKAPSVPKSEEAHGKSEGASAKSEEAHGRSEEAHGKSEEVHGKSEEAHGKSQEVHGKSEEASAKTGESSAASGEAHGKSEEASGKSGEAHGKSEEAHGKS